MSSSSATGGRRGAAAGGGGAGIREGSRRAGLIPTNSMCRLSRMRLLPSSFAPTSRKGGLYPDQVEHWRQVV